jgi:hypothetical protein
VSAEEKEVDRPEAAAYPTRWPVRCPSCARRELIELPYGEEPGRTGGATCAVGHRFWFRYDGVTVVVSGPPRASRRLRPA